MVFERNIAADGINIKVMIGAFRKINRYIFRFPSYIKKANMFKPLSVVLFPDIQRTVIDADIIFQVVVVIAYDRTFITFGRQKFYIVRNIFDRNAVKFITDSKGFLFALTFLDDPAEIKSDCCRTDRTDQKS